jgi:serine/threonine protein kinase
MNPTPEESSSADDPRLLRAVQEYLHELEAGRRPDRRAFAERHPDLAKGMAPYLDALDAMHAASPLLHQPAASRSIPESDSYPPEPLGDFRILREIGRGGMGVVYEAVQLSLGRRVALKVLPFAAALDARQLQRFKNEAQAAAQLHHANIVPVFGVGCERGVHYYAMQLIEGQNLAALVEELRRSQVPGEASELRFDSDSGATGPYPALPLPPKTATADTRSVLGAQLSTQRSNRAVDFFRTVAGLVVQAAEGLEYAHSLGIIHRDVKPANLLVDARGNVWLTDFGLAQFHADAGLTQSGDLLGTLRYMSPEQAGGPRILIDHRTDVYSLGATLYELLTLRPIFDGTDRQTLLQQILHEEPKPPRSLDRAIPEELETIVLRAVAKLPAERYASARDFADDLHRFLEDRPIRARRPSLWEKATKLARRHKPVVASAVVALLLLVAGLAVATALTARAYDRERQKATEADEQRDRAEENFRKALEVVNQLVRIGEEELADKPDLEGLRLRLLEAALAYYQNFLDQHRDDPTIQKELETSQAKARALREELTILMRSIQYVPLHQKEVQEELQLTADQREALNRMRKKWGEGFQRGWGRARGDRERLRLELAREQEAEVLKLLSPGQYRRFKEIALQFLGPFAFSAPEVAEALQLTAEQKKQIRTIQEQFGIWFLGPPFGPPGGGPKEARKNVQEKILGLLTREQKQKWDDLVGKPFEGLRPPYPPQPGPQGAPPGGPTPPKGWGGAGPPG